jgi:hypothetical protein
VFRERESLASSRSVHVGSNSNLNIVLLDFFSFFLQYGVQGSFACHFLFPSSTVARAPSYCRRRRNRTVNRRNDSISLHIYIIHPRKFIIMYLQFISTFGMSQSRLLSSRVLDESSWDVDDEVIIAASQIVQSASQRKPGGSVLGRVYIYRDREAGHTRLYQDYFAEHPTYGPSVFRRR